MVASLALMLFLQSLAAMQMAALMEKVFVQGVAVMMVVTLELVAAQPAMGILHKALMRLILFVIAVLTDVPLEMVPLLVVRHKPVGGLVMTMAAATTMVVLEVLNLSPSMASLPKNTRLQSCQRSKLHPLNPIPFLML